MSFPVMYNACYGGFGFSHRAVSMYNARTQAKLRGMAYDIDRTDKVMAGVVKELKEAANGFASKLKIINIPEKYRSCINVSEYDGMESVSIDFDKYRLSQIAAIIKEATEAESGMAARIQAVLSEPEHDIYNQEVIQEDEPPHEEPAMERSHFVIQ